MDLAYDPVDDASFSAVSKRVVAQFERTRDGKGLGWVVEQLLEFKRGYLDGHLAHWTPADLSEIFYEIYPRKVMLEPGDEAEVLKGTTAFLRFLEAEGVYTGSDVTKMCELVDIAEAPFRVAMADERRWGPGKRVWSGAIRAGVDLNDRSQVEAYMRSFNALPYAARDSILGPLPTVTLPPVVLAPHDELAAAADQTALIRWMRSLIDHIGKGVTLTDKGNLKLADGKALAAAFGDGGKVDAVTADQLSRARSSEELADVSWVVRLAFHVEFLLEYGKRAVPGDAAALLADDPLEAVSLLWHAMLDEVGPAQHHWVKDPHGFGWYAADIDAELPAWHLQLYGNDAGLDLDQATTELWDDLIEDAGLMDAPPAKLEFHRSLVARGVLGAFQRLEQLGMVVLSDVQEKGLAPITGTVHLTALGTAVVQRYAADFTAAPVVGSLAAVEVEVLLAKVVDLADDVARLEVRHWTDLRDDGPAQLVAALATASETSRGVAFAALLDLGPAAIAAVEPLRFDPELAPFRTILRVDALVADASEMATAGAQEWVALLGMVLALRGPHAVTVWAEPAAGSLGLLPMIEAAWRVRSPQTGEVLETLSSTASDKAVAKAARKAAYKFRSAS